jgi:hypothetical protein
VKSWPLRSTRTIGLPVVLLRQALLSGDRVRLSLRMSREDASVVLAAARQAGLAPGACVAALVQGVAAVSGGASRAEYLAALIASTAELPILSRDLRHLTSLLRQGNVEAARPYRDMLDNWRATFVAT